MCMVCTACWLIRKVQIVHKTITSNYAEEASSPALLLAEKGASMQSGLFIQ